MPAISKQRSQHRATRRGVAAVELAVCLPVIILLVFGAIEASSFIFLKQSLNVAAYEGIRESIRISSNTRGEPVSGEIEIYRQPDLAIRSMVPSLRMVSTFVPATIFQTISSSLLQISLEISLIR